MKSTPLVSVVIASYNHARYVRRTVESVAAQTISDIEIIICDDASTDNTGQVIAQIQDDRIVFAPAAINSGRPAVTRNRGIALARGEFVAFVDSDDLWLPQKLEMQLDLLAHHPVAGLCYCDFEIFRLESGDIIARYGAQNPLFDGMVISDLLLENFVGSPTPLVRKKVLDSVGRFDENPSVRFREDWDLWLRIAARHEFCVVRQVLARYGVHALNTFMSQDRNHAVASYSHLLRKAMLENPAIPRERFLEAMRVLYTTAGRPLIIDGDWGTVIRACRMAGMSGSELLRKGFLGSMIWDYLTGLPT